MKCVYAITLLSLSFCKEASGGGPVSVEEDGSTELSDITNQIGVLLQMFDVKSQVALGWGLGGPCPDEQHVWPGWKGVGCNTSVQVTSINVTSSNLTGTLPDDMTNLSFLEELILNDNGLFGSLPSFLPATLQTLSLSSNSLTGTIPESTQIATSLLHVNLSSNNLRGTVGDAFSKASDLTSLDLSQNSFVGPFPNIAFDGIRDVVLFGNGFNGSVPEELANSESVSTVQLYQNKFSGTLPKGFGTSANLTVLFVDTNGFSGNVPKFSNIVGVSSGKLSQLTLSDNPWSCPLPKIPAAVWVDSYATSCSTSHSFWKNTWVLVLMICLGVLYVVVAGLLFFKCYKRRKAKKESKKFQTWVEDATNDEKQGLIQGNDDQRDVSKVSCYSNGSFDGATEDLPAGEDPFVRNYRYSNRGSYKAINVSEGARHNGSPIPPSGASSSTQQARSLDPTLSLFTHVSSPHTIFKDHVEQGSPKKNQKN